MGSAQSSEADSGRACGMTWSEDANQTVCCTLFQGQPGEDGKGATPSKAGRRVSTSLEKVSRAGAKGGLTRKPLLTSFENERASKDCRAMGKQPPPIPNNDDESADWSPQFTAHEADRDTSLLLNRKMQLEDLQEAARELRIKLQVLQTEGGPSGLSPAKQESRRAMLDQLKVINLHINGMSSSFPLKAAGYKYIGPESHRPQARKDSNSNLEQSPEEPTVAPPTCAPKGHCPFVLAPDPITEENDSTKSASYGKFWSPRQDKIKEEEATADSTDPSLKTLRSPRLDEVNDEVGSKIKSRKEDVGPEIVWPKAISPRLPNSGASSSILIGSAISAVGKSKGGEAIQSHWSPKAKNFLPI